MKAISTLLALLLTASFATAGDQPLPPRVSDIEYPISYWIAPLAADSLRVLDRDVSAYLAPDPRVRRIAVDLVVSVYDVEVPEAAILAAEAVAGGTPRGEDPGAFREALARSGGRIALACRGPLLVIGLTAPPEGFDAAFALFLRLLRDPRVEGHALRALKAGRLDAWRLRDETPGLRERETYFQIASGGEAGFLTASGMDVWTAGNLPDAFASLLSARRISIGVSGPFQDLPMLDTLDGITKELSEGPKEPRTPPQASTGLNKLVLVGTDAPLASGTAGFPLPPLSDERNAAIEVALNLLARRALRAFQARHQVSSGFETDIRHDPAGHRHALFSFRLPPPWAVDLVSVLLEEANRLASNLARDRDVLAAAETIKRRRRLAFACSRAQARTFASMHGVPGDVTKMDGFTAVTAGEVRDAAEAVLAPSRFLAVISGPADGIRSRAEHVGLGARGLDIEAGDFFLRLDRTK